MYDAMDIAEYVLEFCENRLGTPITNLQLQKILYYIQGRYIAETHEPLFDNCIQAWRYGPVIPDVYYWYNDFMSSPITGETMQNDIHFSEEEENIMQEVAREKSQMNPWKLVDATHNERPWKDNYIQGLNCEIPLYDLELYPEIFTN